MVPLPPVWSSAKAHDCAAIATARANLQARAREEHNRLLYVAMTRAADRLVIAPYRGRDRESEASWCEMVRTGLERAFGPGETVETGYGPITLWPEGKQASLALGATAADPTAARPPGWLSAPVTTEDRSSTTVSPSAALGAADAQRDAGERQSKSEARRRGILVHALLEHLPRLDPERRSEAAAAFARARAPGIPQSRRDGIVAAVLRLLDQPDLAPIFARDARAEVTLSGQVTISGKIRPVFGRVDRIAVGTDTVWIADFKSSRPPAPEAPPSRAETDQIALYAALLRQIYPKHRVQPVLVWTSGPVIRRLAAAEIDEALAALARPAA